MKEINPELESTPPRWDAEKGRWIEPEEFLDTGDESPKQSNETGLDLSQVESFSQWLDARGDSLAPADSFDQWLKEREDSIP